MANSFLEWVSGVDATKHRAEGYSIAPGIVKDNVNVLSEGRVEIHVPSCPAFDPLARLVGLGGGSSRGFFWVPEIGDEVLVAFNQNDERDAYILGGMWSMTTRPPVDLFAQQILKRVIQTGKKDSPATGHTVEFDDALQSITIKTSTAPGLQPQQIVMDPKKIEITANQGTMKISMDVGPPPAITIQALTGNIELKAPAGQITLNAAQINMTGTAAINVQSTGPCALQGLPLRLNS